MKAKAPTVDEWQAEITRLSKIMGDEGLTMRELMRKFGRCRQTTERILSRIQDQGRLKVGRKQVSSLDGITRIAPCYSIQK